MDREAALAEIRRLAESHHLTAAAITEALGVERTHPDDKRLVRFFSYLGGIFLFAGVGTFVGLNWDTLPSLPRVLVTLGLGLSLFIAAFAVQQTGYWNLLPGPLYGIAELLQPAGMLVAFHEFGGGAEHHSVFLITSGVCAIQVMGAHRIQAHPVLLFCAVLFAGWFGITGFDWAALDPDLSAAIIGFSVLLIVRGLNRDRYPEVVAIWTCFAGIIFYSALFDWLRDGAGEWLFVAAAGGGLYFAIRWRSRGFLVISVVALLGYLSYLTAKHFSDPLGWPVVLILIGFVCLGLGYAALWVNRRYLSEPSRSAVF